MRAVRATGCRALDACVRKEKTGRRVLVIWFASRRINEMKYVTWARMKQQSYLAYALQGNGIDRADTAGCNGCGWKANVSYTLNTIDRHAVCYHDPADMDKLVCTDARGNGNGKVCANVTGDHERRVTDYTNIITYGGDKAGTLDASYYKGAGARNGKSHLARGA